MSFQCSKCFEDFTTLNTLNKHLRKSCPCDFQCRLCVYKGDNRNGYYYHMRVRHPPNVATGSAETDQAAKPTVAPAKENPRARVRLPDDSTKSIVPIQDFDRETLSGMIRELSQLANKNDVDVDVDIHIRIHPKKKKLAEDAVKFFQTSDYAQSLKCLEGDINKTAVDMLDSFHGDPSRPQLHAIRLADNARKLVKMYSRPAPDEECSWLTFGPQPTLDTLSEHARALLTYGLERAASMLQYKFCVKEKSVCFCLHDDVLSKNLIVVDANEFGERDGGLLLRRLGYQPRLKVLVYDGELGDILVPGFGYTGKALELGQLINQKTDEVLRQIAELQFSEADISAFLERTRRPLTLTTAKTSQKVSEVD